MRDVVALFVHCLKNGKVIAFFRFILYLVFSDYNALRKEVPLLRVSQQSINQIANNNSLFCKQMKAFTIHTTRKSYVLSLTAM